MRKRRGKASCLASLQHLARRCQNSNRNAVQLKDNQLSTFSCGYGHQRIPAWINVACVADADNQRAEQQGVPDAPEAGEVGVPNCSKRRKIVHRWAGLPNLQELSEGGKTRLPDVWLDSKDDIPYVKSDIAELQGTATSQPLTEEQLVLRRLDGINKLFRIYKVEYWGMYEELHLRHQRYNAQEHTTAWKDGRQPACVAAKPAPAGNSCKGIAQRSIRWQLRGASPAAGSKSCPTPAGEHEPEASACGIPCSCNRMSGGRQLCSSSQRTSTSVWRHQQSELDKHGSMGQLERCPNKAAAGIASTGREGKREAVAEITVRPASSCAEAEQEARPESSGTLGTEQPDVQVVEQDCLAAKSRPVPEKTEQHSGDSKVAAEQQAFNGLDPGLKANGVANEQQPPAAAVQHWLTSSAADPGGTVVESAVCGSLCVGCYGDDVRGYGSDDEVLAFSDVEEAMLDLDPEHQAVKPICIASWRACFRHHLAYIGRLEQLASAASAREQDEQGALATLSGRTACFLICRSAVTLGRSTHSHGQVDIDMSNEGAARKVSRQQAVLTLHADGHFRLSNTGRRTLLLNGRPMAQGQVARLRHLSLVEVGGVRLLFMLNHAAVRRLLALSKPLLAAQ